MTRTALILAALLTLTRPDGAKVAIVTAQIVGVQTPIPGTGVCMPPAKTIVMTMSGQSCVVESVGDVIKGMDIK